MIFNSYSRDSIYYIYYSVQRYYLFLKDALYYVS
jgi:hypothetical protein